MAELARMYNDTRVRIIDFVGSLDQDALNTRVPGCPAWTVHDVVGHLTGITEDVMAGTLTGPPDEGQTAQQVARYSDRDLGEVIETWSGLATEFQPLLDSFEVWPAVIDILTHEQDIRGAVGDKGERDNADLRIATGALITVFDPTVPILLKLEDKEFRVGPDEGDLVTLETTWFETFRWRMGRRSRSQIESMSWSSSPTDFIDSLSHFSPSEVDVVE